MSKKAILILFLVGVNDLFFSTQLFPAEIKGKSWTLASEFSYVTTSGNSETSTASFDSLYQRKWLKTNFELSSGLLFSSQSATIIAEQYNIGEKLEYKIEKKLYLYELLEWLKNQFVGLNNQYKLQTGGGYWFRDSELDKLKGELGVGYTIEERKNTSKGTSYEEYSSYRIYGKYEHNFSDTASFAHESEFLGNMEDSVDFEVNAITALTTVLNRNLSSKISYTLKYNNQPVPGFKKTDTIVTSALILKL